MFIRRLLRKIYCYLKYKRHNKNLNPSIISANCIGGVITHDLRLRFNSPTIDLYIVPRDFVKLCGNLKSYMDSELIFFNSHIGCPTAKLKDVTIFFLHYKSEEEARQKWLLRKQRIDYNNLFFVMTDRDDCSYEDLKLFDMLNGCRNKVVFTHKHYPEFKSSFYLSDFKDNTEVGVVTDFKRCSFKRYLDRV